MKPIFAGALLAVTIFLNVTYAQNSGSVTLDFESPVKTLGQKESFLFEGVKVYYPEGWRVRKAKATEGVVIEGPFAYSAYGRYGRFGIVVGKDLHPDIDVDTFAALVKQQLEEKNRAAFLEARTNVTLKDGEKLQFDVDDVGKVSMNKVLRDGITTYAFKVASRNKMNGEVFDNVTASMFFVVDSWRYTVSITYPQSESNRFEEFAQWVIDHVEIETEKIGNKIKSTE